MIPIFRISPNQVSIFSFDESLIEDSGKLQPNQLTVDSLTVDWLQSRLEELDARVKNEQERMLQLGETIINTSKGHDGNTYVFNYGECVNPKNFQKGRIYRGIILPFRHASSPELARKRRELMEMRCDERKLTRQLELIKSALKNLDCEELPSGCDCSADNSFAPPPEPEVRTYRV